MIHFNCLYKYYLLTLSPSKRCNGGTSISITPTYANNIHCRIKFINSDIVSLGGHDPNTISKWRMADPAPQQILYLKCDYRFYRRDFMVNYDKADYSIIINEQCIQHNSESFASRNRKSIRGLDLLVGNK